MSKSSLIVEVLHANDVPRDRLKKNDPYVVVFFKGFFIFTFEICFHFFKSVLKGIKQRTSHKNSEINPILNEVFFEVENYV
jgi:hypothetical protein